MTEQHPRPFRRKHNFAMFSDKMPSARLSPLYRNSCRNADCAICGVLRKITTRAITALLNVCISCAKLHLRPPVMPPPFPLVYDNGNQEDAQKYYNFYPDTMQRFWRRRLKTHDIARRMLRRGEREVKRIAFIMHSKSADCHAGNVAAIHFVNANGRRH